MKRNFYTLFPVFIIFFASVNDTQANTDIEINSVSSAINKAGSQRMLTQRILKFYAMSGIGVDMQNESSWNQLKEEITLYNKQLDDLKKFSSNRKVTKSLELVTKLWSSYQNVLTEPVTRKNAQWLINHNEELLLASHNVVVQLHDTLGSNYTKLVNISGRQRMLSQMLAKLYMLNEWGFHNEESIKQIEQVKQEFKIALSQLIRAKENSESIRKALNDVKSEWELFEYGLERNNKKPIPLIVALMSEKILNKMDDITSMYEKLSEN